MSIITGGLGKSSGGGTPDPMAVSELVEVVVSVVDEDISASIEIDDIVVTIESEEV